MKAAEDFKKKKILIVNVNWIGDVLFSTPSIKLIKDFYPSSHLACMVVPRCEEILKNNPFIDELIVFDERNTHRSFFSKLKFVFLLRRKKFDTVFVFHRSFTRALICYLAGIPERIGYYRKKSGFLLTAKIEAEEEVHRVDYFLNLLRIKGLETKDKNYRFFIKEEDRNFAGRFLKEGGVGERDFLVCLNPGGNWDLKRWPPQNFALLGDLIAEKYGARILITGAGKDRQLVSDIAAMMKHEPILSAGKTTLSQLAALFEKSRLVISADSGPLHIAVCMQRPAIALFGPTSPQITGPFSSAKLKVIQEDVGCLIPCYQLDCALNKCMRAITPEKVIKVIDEEKFL